MNERPFSKSVICSVVKVKRFERLQMFEVEVGPGCRELGGGSGSCDIIWMLLVGGILDRFWGYSKFSCLHQ